MITNIIILIFSISVLAFIFFFTERLDKRRASEEKLRFREFVIAIKAKDVEQYAQIIPEDVEEKKIDEKVDEYMDVDEVSPETLLKALKQK
jgi:hypothetical protein